MSEFKSKSPKVTRRSRRPSEEERALAARAIADLKRLVDTHARLLVDSAEGNARARQRLDDLEIALASFAKKGRPNLLSEFLGSQHPLRLPTALSTVTKLVAAMRNAGCLSLSDFETSIAEDDEFDGAHLVPMAAAHAGCTVDKLRETLDFVKDELDPSSLMSNRNLAILVLSKISTFGSPRTILRRLKRR